jgi:hypothetical protein
MVANGSDTSVGLKIMVSMSEDMVKSLDLERKSRRLETIPETVRAVLGEYFKVKDLK